VLVFFLNNIKHPAIESQGFINRDSFEEAVGSYVSRCAANRLNFKLARQTQQLGWGQVWRKRMSRISDSLKLIIRHMNLPLTLTRLERTVLLTDVSTSHWSRIHVFFLDDF
jgi:hypothetical protein